MNRKSAGGGMDDVNPGAPERRWKLPAKLRRARWVMPMLVAVVLTPFFAVGMLSLGAVADAPECTITGTPDDDVLEGTEGDDVICGLGGDDIINGGEGDDYLIGGDGDDDLTAGPGNDRIAGEGGNDRAVGGEGFDEIRGGNGRDVLIGGPGFDLLFGDRGEDELAGGNGNDELFGGSGNDQIRGGAGDDVLHGGVGSDVLRGGVGQDNLRGGLDVDVCFDTFDATATNNCEFGRGGDDDPLAIRTQQWANVGDDEIAYSLTVDPVCHDWQECTVEVSAETVVARGDDASGFDGAPGLAPKELFALAGVALDSQREIEFDEQTGLPIVVEMSGGSVVRVDNVEFRDEVRARYERALEAWDKVGPTEYSYVVQRGCYCPLTAPTRVSVTDGPTGLQAVGSAVTGVDVPEAMWANGVIGLDERLSLLGDALDGGYISVDAEFDLETGAPTWVALDPGNGLLDEITIEISEVEITAGALIEAEVEVDVMGVSLSTSSSELVIVTVKGIEVNELIADDVAAMVEAAAIDGITLSGNGYRSTERQISLRRQNCGTSNWDIYQRSASSCSPPTAVPGSSQHEIGLAIDFRNNGHAIVSRSDPAFVWLAEHAGQYGFFNLPSEPWHWSTTGT